MESFNFDFHDPVTEYPEEGERGVMGGSYQYVVMPVAPPQRLVRLMFDQMVLHTRANGAIDVETDARVNFGALEQFYQRHRLYKEFVYRHPTYGDMVVRFQEPLKTPRIRRGVTEAFTITLIEQP